jgi:hypothetical protein
MQKHYGTIADKLILKYFLGNSLIHFFFEMYPNKEIQLKLREQDAYVVTKKYLEAALKAHYTRYQKKWQKTEGSFSDDCTACHDYVKLPTEISEKPHLPYNASEIEVLQCHNILSLAKPFKQNFGNLMVQGTEMVYLKKTFFFLQRNR